MGFTKKIFTKKSGNPLSLRERSVLTPLRCLTETLAPHRGEKSVGFGYGGGIVRNPLSGGENRFVYSSNGEKERDHQRLMTD